MIAINQLNNYYGNNLPISGFTSRLQVRITLLSQDIVNNTSQVRWEIGWQFVFNDRGLRNGDLSVNGVSVWDVSGQVNTFSQSNVNQNTFEIYQTGTATIPHNEDGTKTFNIDGSIDGFTNQGYRPSALSQNIILPSIPRSSPATINDDDIDSDQSIIITSNQPVDSYWHRAEIILSGKTPVRLGNPLWQETLDYNMGTIKTTLGNLIPSDPSISGVIRVTTYRSNSTSSSNRVGFIDIPITYTIINAEPTFVGPISIRDSNSTTTGVTGNNQYYIQNYSTPRVSFSRNAVGRFGASEARYSSLLENILTNTSTTGTATFNHPPISSEESFSLVTAFDTRGYSTQIRTELNVIPYTSPTINLVAERRNGFEDTIEINVSGTLSPIKVGNNLRNNITASGLQYRTRLEGNSSWTSWTNIVRNINADRTTFTGNRVNISRDNTRYVDIEVRVIDRLTTTVSQTRVDAGSPILFVDSNKRAIGVNQFPTSNDEGLHLKVGDNLFSQIYPVGSVVIRNSNTDNPSTKWGGTWILSGTINNSLYLWRRTS